MFVIVRHGNTFEAGERPRRIGARTDLPLTATGLKQAEALGVNFMAREFGFGRILVSPLARTQQTAWAIVAQLANTPKPETADWLREIDHGPDEDRTEPEVLTRVGAAALAAWDARAVPPPGWTVDAEARIAGWRALFAQECRPTLLVTSNGAARFALVAAGGEVGGDMKLATGAYGVIRKACDGTLSVSEWGTRP